MIEVQGLTKGFGTLRVLKGISFSAAEGCITGLLGPNGAGKSTTLRILATILKADAGTARVDGIEVGADPVGVRARLGVLPHNANLYANLTARENIAYYAALQGIGRPEQGALVQGVITLLGIQDIAERRAKGFSQGERIRVALARAMVHNPRVLVLDEPSNGLDVVATRTLRRIIRERRDAGCCVLLSSHVMQEVAALCDHIVILANGAVAVDGTTEEIRTATGCDDLEEAFVRAIGGADDEQGGAAGRGVRR